MNEKVVSTMRRILIIDDEPQYRILMQRLLEEAGYQAAGTRQSLIW